MSEQAGSMGIELGVRNGQGRAVCTVSENLYAILLEELEVDRAEEIDPNIFRQLVLGALTDKLIESQERNAPGSVSMYIRGQKEGDPEFTEIRSSDVGFEMMMLIPPAFTEEEATLLDPTYSPVVFELRVCKDRSTPEAARAAKCVLNLVLEPPDLA